MRSAMLLVLLFACDTPDAPGSFRHAVDEQPPPGVHGITLSGPTSVYKEETYTWTVTAPDLTDGERVALGWGDTQAAGRCPTQGQSGGSPCLDIQRFGGSAALIEVVTVQGGQATFELTAPGTYLEEVFLQAFWLAGPNSATSNVLGVDIFRNWCSFGNGGCPGICTNTPSGPSCDVDCDPGMWSQGGPCETITAFKTAGEYEPGIHFFSVFDADQICRDEANGAGYPHGDSFYALISSTDRGARERGVPSFPLHLPNGRLIATSDADLWDGSIAAPFTLTIANVTAPSPPWTGTTSDGSREPLGTGSGGLRRNLCGNWAGDPISNSIVTAGGSGTNGTWINGFDPNVPANQGSSCTQELPLYCVSGDVCDEGWIVVGGVCVP